MSGSLGEFLAAHWSSGPFSLDELACCVTDAGAVAPPLSVEGEVVDLAGDELHAVSAPQANSAAVVKRTKRA